MTGTIDPRIGTELLGYRIEALAGRGGMGIVYRAYDPRLKRHVALKLIAPELAADNRFRERFLAETELAASLEHPNVVPIHEAGELGGQLVLVMRHVVGNDLKILLAQEGPLEPRRALAICAQVASALDAAHARGLVHRDVKPSNVLLDEQEHVYLADFGLTRQMAESGKLGQSLGTPDYAAPEQIESGDVDGRADVYSLACVLYECLSGQPPYRRDSELATLWSQLNDPAPKLAAYPALDTVIARALAKDPEERYARCRELVEAAEQALGLRAPDRRPLLLAALGGVLVAGALAAGLLLTFTGRSSSPKPDLTVRDNTLVRIHPKTGRVVAVTPVGRHGFPLSGAEGVAVGGGKIWVYNWDEQNVRAINPDTNEVERSVSVAGIASPTPAGSITADAGGAWVLSNSNGRGTVTRVPVSPYLLPRSFAVPYDPLAVSSGLGGIWVGAKNLSGSAVLRIEPRTGRVRAVVRLRGAVISESVAGTNGLRDVQAVSAGAQAIWAAQGGTLFRIDPATNRVNARANFPTKEIAALATGPSEVWALICDAGQGAFLARIEPRTLRVAGRAQWSGAHCGNFPGGIALGEGAVWWNGGDTGLVAGVEPESGKVVSVAKLTPPEGVLGNAIPVGIAAGAGAVWTTVATPP